MAIGVAAIVLVVIIVIISDIEKTVKFDSSEIMDTVLADNGTETTLSNTPSGSVTATVHNRTWLEFTTSTSGIDTGSAYSVINASDNQSYSVWFNTTQSCSTTRYLVPITSSTRNIVCEDGFLIAEFQNVSSDSVFLSYNVTINDSAWHHAVLTISNSSNNWTLYIDGSAVNSTNLRVAGTNYRPDIALLGVNSWGGSIDESRFYRSFLSPTNVSDIFNSERRSNSSLPSTDLILWYPINENSGTVTFDNSGDSNNGSITAGTYQNDQINNSLVEDTDFAVSGTSFNITNDRYAWDEAVATYNTNTRGVAKSSINKTVVGMGTFADFWTIIVLSVVAAIIIGIIFGAFAFTRRTR